MMMVMMDIEHSISIVLKQQIKKIKQKYKYILVCVVKALKHHLNHHVGK